MFSLQDTNRLYQQGDYISCIYTSRTMILSKKTNNKEKELYRKLIYMSYKELYKEDRFKDKLLMEIIDHPEEADIEDMMEATTPRYPSNKSVVSIIDALNFMIDSGYLHEREHELAVKQVIDLEKGQELLKDLLKT